MDSDLSAALTAVGPRLRELRRQRETTLTALAESTGISLSTARPAPSPVGRRGPAPSPVACPGSLVLRVG